MPGFTGARDGYPASRLMRRDVITWLMETSRKRWGQVALVGVDDGTLQGPQAIGPWSGDRFSSYKYPRERRGGATQHSRIPR